MARITHFGVDGWCTRTVGSSGLKLKAKLGHISPAAMKRAKSYIDLRFKAESSLVRLQRAGPSPSSPVDKGNRCGSPPSFPKIISGCIDDVIRPILEWRQWLQIAGRLDAKVHLSVMSNACALDCNRPHRRKEFAADAPRQRSAFGPDTRDARCRSDVPHMPFCHGDPGEIGRSRIPIALTRDVKTCP